MSPEARGQQDGRRDRQDREPDRPPEGGVEGGDTNRRCQDGVARELGGEDDRQNRGAE
jgi:hypothetical protein